MNTGTTRETGRTATATSPTSAGRGQKSEGASSKDAPPAPGSTSTDQSDQTMSVALTPRLYREMLKIKANLPKQSIDFHRGSLYGLRRGMIAMYPDADAFVTQDPRAKELVLTYLAIEETINDQ